jgi:hypothetical protein
VAAAAALVEEVSVEALADSVAEAAVVAAQVEAGRLTL